MAVYYHYNSGVQTFSVPVPAPSVSIANLKSPILRTARHGHGRTHGCGQRESVARTIEEYTDGSALITRNSSTRRCWCARSPGLPRRPSQSRRPCHRGRPKQRRVMAHPRTPP
ncbi:hypothetical protein C2845_PM15G03620 [Panicum miliaceum]|uniref:DWNN domain-containing protein n=1 Tax=Panicum miliaceum TaxID=4540 RepID=A0A3L6Q7Z5_PANMI|nr:hypothetical protein C2845_PM15G03620 [Panicum miliaceum]